MTKKRKRTPKKSKIAREKSKKAGKNSKNSRKLINKYKLALFFLLIIIICAGAIRLFYESYSIIEVRKLPVKIIVRDVVGLGLEENVMFFGGIPPGATSKRQIIIVNYKPESLKASISYSGPIKKWIQTTEDNFILENNQEKRIDFFVYIPENTKEAEYQGEVIITFNKNN